jgi:hypothetical protein
VNPNGFGAPAFQLEGSEFNVLEVQIPMHRGHLLRFDRGQATDLMAATIPI